MLIVMLTLLLGEISTDMLLTPTNPGVSTMNNMVSGRVLCGSVDEPRGLFVPPSPSALRIL